MPHRHLKNTGLSDSGSNLQPLRPKSVDELDIPSADFHSSRDLLEKFLATPLQTTYSSPSTGKKVTVKNAMVIMKPGEMRDSLVDALAELNLEVFLYDNFEMIFVSEYQKAELIILESRQGDYHAVDLMRLLIRDEALSPTRFVIIGRNPADAREHEWQGLGKGLFMRSRLPLPWIKRTLAEWLTEEMKPEEVNPSMQLQPLLLIVDDDREFIEVFQEALQLKLYRVITAENGAEAVKQVRKMKPDVVLMDVDMPEKSGFEALRTLRAFKSTERIPVIIMTAHQENRFQHEAVQLGATAFMQKPLDLNHVHDQIQHIITAREWE